MTPQIALAQLELHVDVTNEEMYFLGSDSGAPSGGLYSGNRMAWSDPTYAPSNTQGLIIPVSGADINFLNLSVSQDSESLTVFSGELPSGVIDLNGVGERVDYSWMLLNVKRILSESDGAQLLLVQGIGLSPISVVVENASTEQLLTDLIAAVMALNVNSGLSNSLDAKLQAALSALDDLNSNNDVAAINGMYAFCSNVAAQRDKGLTDVQATQLIDAVNSVILSIDEYATLCP
jgi:hypothetical protein